MTLHTAHLSHKVKHAEAGVTLSNRLLQQSQYLKSRAENNDNYQNK